MTSESGERQIRSYHRAFHFELVLYSLGNLRPWRPIPARGIFYGAAAEIVMGVLAHTPLLGAAVSGLGWEAVYGVIPAFTAWLLTVARIEGRRFHVAFRACARHVFDGAMLVGGYRKAPTPGSRWRPRPVVLFGDGRDGAAPSGLRLVGPGRVLLRYPCEARLDGPRMTIAQTSDRPCDPARVLRIADGASVRFIARRDLGDTTSGRGEEDTSPGAIGERPANALGALSSGAPPEDESGAPIVETVRAGGGQG